MQKKRMKKHNFVAERAKVEILAKKGLKKPSHF